MEKSPMQLNNEGQTPSQPWYRRLRNWLWGYDFFVSYHWSSGGKYAVNLAAKLRERGFDVFLDRSEYAMGDDWRQVGETALRNTRRLILVATREAVFESLPVKREVSLFTDRGRHIIPIYFGDMFATGDDAGRLPTVFKQLQEATLYVEDTEQNLNESVPDTDVVNKLVAAHGTMKRRNLRQLVTLAAASTILIFGIGASLARIETERTRANAAEQKMLDSQRLADEQGQRAHIVARNAAFENAARGNWRAALVYFNQAIADSQPDKEELEVMRARAWFPLGDRKQLDAQLTELEQRATSLKGHQATLKLLRGDYLMAEPKSQKQGIELLQQALQGTLSPADEQYAKGLVERDVKTAEAALRKAVELEGFHHRANSALALLLVLRGKSADAGKQIDFMKRAFPEDPSAYFLHAWLLALDGNPQAPDILDESLAKLSLKKHVNIDRLKEMLRLNVDVITSLKQQGAFGSGLPIMGKLALAGDIAQLGLKFGASPALGEFGLSLPGLRWYSEGFDAYVAAMADPLFLFSPFANKQRTIDKLERAINVHPDGLFLYSLATVKAMHAKRHLFSFRPDTQAIARELHKCGDIYNQAIDADCFYPPSRHCSKVMALSIDCWIYHVMSEPRNPDLHDRITRRLKELLGSDEFLIEELKKVAEFVVPLYGVDAEVVRSLLKEWRKYEPEDLRPVQLLSNVEFRDQNYGLALNLCDHLLSTTPNDPDAADLRNQCIQKMTERIEHIESAPTSGK